MKIIITSDLHGNKEIINYILMNYDADYFYDCGDSQLSNYELKEFYSVLGNCDFYPFPTYRIINIDDYLKIFITHGHLYSDKEMIELAKINKCKLIVHGHTHIKRYEMMDGITLLNPGSISRPRAKDSNSILVINYDDKEFKIFYDFLKITLLK